MNQFLKFIIINFYFVTVGFYTFYGVVKSGNEYFCLQKRPDDPDYRSLVIGQVLNITKANGRLNTLVAFNNKLHLLKYKETKLLKPVDGNSSVRSGFDIYEIDSELGTTFDLKYIVGTSWFSIRCGIEKGEGNIQENFNETNLYSFVWKNYGVNELGYIDDEVTFTLMELNVENPLASSLFKCDIEKSPQTCQTKIETINLFFTLYMVIAGVYLTMSLLSLTNFKQKFFRRLMYYINDNLSSKGSLDFCNPITGKPTYCTAGETVIKLTESSSNYQKVGFMSDLNDKQGQYRIISENEIAINCKTYNGVLRGDKSNIKTIGDYFCKVFLNNKMCAIDQSGTHFLKTIEVIQHLMGGGGLIEVEMNKNSFVLNVKEFEFKYLKRNFDIAPKEIGVFLTHNWNFFSETYNLESLINCIRGKTWSRDAPKGVKNSQWKLYTSDFKQLALLVSKKTYKCQKVHKLTLAAEDAITYWEEVAEMDDYDFNKTIVKIKNTLEFKPDKDKIECDLRFYALKTHETYFPGEALNLESFIPLSRHNDLSEPVEGVKSALDEVKDLIDKSNSFNGTIQRVVDSLKNKDNTSCQSLEKFERKSDASLRRLCNDKKLYKNVINKFQEKSREVLNEVHGVFKTYKEALENPLTIEIKREVVGMNTLKQDLKVAQMCRDKREIKRIEGEIFDIRKNPQKNQKIVEEISENGSIKNRNMCKIRKALVIMGNRIIRFDKTLELLDELEKQKGEQLSQPVVINKIDLLEKVFDSKVIKYGKTLKKRGKMKKQETKVVAKFDIKKNRKYTMKKGFFSPDFEYNLKAAEQKMKDKDSDMDKKKGRLRSQKLVEQFANKIHKNKGQKLGLVGEDKLKHEVYMGLDGILNKDCAGQEFSCESQLRVSLGEIYGLIFV